MISGNYEDFLVEKLKMFYDLNYGYEIGKFRFDFFAKFNQRSSKYIVSKKIEFYAFKNNEYFFFKKFDSGFDIKYLESLKIFLNENIHTITEIDHEHMSSIVTFIFEVNGEISDELALAVENFKYYKSFMFGLKGWVNCGLMLINPLKNEGISNKFSRKELDKFLIKKGGEQ